MMVMMMMPLLVTAAATVALARVRGYVADDELRAVSLHAAVEPAAAVTIVVPITGLV